MMEVVISAATSKPPTYSSSCFTTEATDKIKVEEKMLSNHSSSIEEALVSQLLLDVLKQQSHGGEL